MKTNSDQIKQLELANGILICPSTDGYQAFRPGCHTVGRGKTPEQAVENWKSKRRPYTGHLFKE